jgi:signal transduction histidine kinase
VTFRRRLLVVSLATLAVGVGALVVTANVVLETRVVTGNEESVERLRREVLGGSVVLALLWGAGGGRARPRAIGGALEPVSEMAAAAEGWSATDLERRFDLGPPRDELTRLAATLDGLLTRIAASRRHEQRFADDVAHELRTPLASLRAQAELAGVPALIEETERLSRTVDTLLELGRRELDPSAYAVDLLAIATDVPDVQITATAGLPAAEGEPEILRRALAPLVENARRHARRGVRLELASGHGRVWIKVRDDGPGLDPELGERAFEPGEGDGTGLGLPLARRLARACGGDVHIGTGPGGCFVLELPAVQAPVRG